MAELLPSDGSAQLWRGFLDQAQSDAVLAAIEQEAGWTQDYIRIQGQTIPLPRLTAWHGTRGYRYSGIMNPHKPWTPVMLALATRLEDSLGVAFNSVLCNRYRTGQDSVAWHADDEPELGRTPTIASISLGAARKFSLKRKDGSGSRIDVMLGHGDLLVMSGLCQQHWLHQLPKSKRVEGERINLTFRQVA